jgi:SAM-dependent methyltransferase
MNVSSYYDYQATARGLATSSEFDRLYDYYRNLYDNLLPAWLPQDKQAAIYEVACGPGLLLKWMTERGYSKARGTDSSKPQITLARSMGLPATLEDSMADLAAMPGDSLDCIIALNFYEHLPKEVFLDFLQLCQKTLKPGGRLILQGPNADSPLVGRNLFNDITHFWAYTSVSLKALFGMFDLKVLASQDDVIEGLYHRRAIKVPVARFARWVLRSLFTAASREHVNSFGMFLWTVGEKAPEGSGPAV